MKPAQEGGVAPTAARPVADPDRRSFLRGRFGDLEQRDVVRPPWSSNASIAEACCGCGACAEGCPENIIVMDHRHRPRVDFSGGACSFCTACVTACPEPVFAKTEEPAWRLTLSISDNCLLRTGIYCRSCGDACAERAILFQPRLGGRADISFVQDDCIGCGACISACPVNATSLSPGSPEEGISDA